MVTQQIYQFYINNLSERDAYYAYLQIFDANTKKERRELLNLITQDPHVAVSFYKNCNPTDIEKEVAFDSISNDIDSTLLFLKECKPEGKYREEAINIVLCDDDYAKKTAYLCNLSAQELELIHNKYNTKWITTDFMEYFNYCLIFKDYLTADEKEFLVDLALESQDIIVAKTIMNSVLYNYLNDKLKDTLESLFILKKLEDR